MPRRTAPDRGLLLITGLLVGWGLFMVGSSSHYLAMSLGQSPYHYLLRHSLYVVLGLFALVGAMHLPYRMLDDRRLVLGLVAITMVALVAVMAMPAAGGARRWFPLGIISVQPSEIAKLVIILFLAHVLSRKENEVNELRIVSGPCVAVTGIMAALIAVEPDLGSAMMIAALMGVMLFVAGLRWSYIGAVAGAGALGVVLAILVEPYRIERIKTFLHPEADLQGSGFQLSQSLIAVGNGGILGVGLGQGQQKAFYLPAAHTDFIFSVIGEELGIVGTAFLLIGFSLLFWRGMRAAVRAPDRFGFYLALGATSLLTIQALIHMAVCLGLFPTKGLPCPFISYGGSSLVASMVAAGLLLNVSQHAS
jgi:cell division protein FtsW